MASMDNTKQILRTFALGAATVGALAMTGCEQSEDTAIASARDCLDHSTTSTEVNACMAKIDGIESSEAYLLRCSGAFVSQGFTGERLANAFDQLKKDSGSGSSSTTAVAMAYFVFKGANATDTNGARTAADTAYNYCTRAGVRSMQRLAVLAQMATTVATVTGDLTQFLNPTSMTSSQLETAITNALTAAVSDPSAPAAIGNLAVTANETYCNAGSSFATSDICKQLDTALAQSTPQAIGQLLLTCLQDPHATGCP
jgi:hypothetical protein